jgi:ABC-type molybdate transport system substrate-binding protein
LSSRLKTNSSVTVTLIGIVGVVTPILLAGAAYFTLSDSWIVITATMDNSQTSPIQRRDPVSVMYAASLLKTFEESLGPAFQADTGYPYQGEARGSVQIANSKYDT